MWKVLKTIGAGGFGNVDLVQDGAGNVFARKTFSRNQPMSDEIFQNVLKRFSKEVRIQSGVVHPNIVPILGHDLIGYPPNYLMPAAAASLAEDIAAERTLGGNFVSCISDIVAGLEELHSMQIYHRDLKPQNVLRFQYPTGSSYAISDFGLVSLKESSLSALTTTGMRKSSDYYTAPEVTQDMRRASAQSDIFSLGCILHDMVGTEDRVPCNEIREPGEFAAILLGCTRKDPAQRFKSVRSVLDAILSVDFAVPAQTGSAASINFAATLDAPSPPAPEFWEHLADYLDHSAATVDRNVICRKLTAEMIQTVCVVDPASATRIGVCFARWVRETAFSFEYCDALANRLEEFFDGTDYEAKVECLMAMLELGTSHNRWYVERKFFNLCGPEMEASLAKRLGVQFRIGDMDVCGKIAHVEWSVSTNRDALHPVLVKTLADLCP